LIVPDALPPPELLELLELLELPEDGALEDDDELELLLEPHATNNSDVNAATAIDPIRRCLTVFSFT